MIKRMKSLHDELMKTQKQRDRVKHKVDTLVSTIPPHENDHRDFIRIIAEEENIAQTPFQRLLWEQQAEYAKC